ncbi:hypothetical protein DL89DRAFT_312056 [Linderina pennispora]|uniref:Uncharacterized protein n=1 Tax=Linderina pennispora TaxID=61395 RepID=A0A1Y1WFD0_9FUNG|nr:uncharacterized protein DL89DRAFT_312056 [Linderina pennispora]ORX72209.1 hypothetical protein DL89DRAFT_312056 [Linderina pennispora]
MSETPDTHSSPDSFDPAPHGHRSSAGEHPEQGQGPGAFCEKKQTSGGPKAENALQQLHAGSVTEIPRPHDKEQKEYIERLFDENLGQSPYYVGAHFFSSVVVAATEVIRECCSRGGVAPDDKTWIGVAGEHRRAMGRELVKKVHGFCPIMAQAAGNWIAMWFLKAAWGGCGECSRREQGDRGAADGSQLEYDPTYKPEAMRAEIEREAVVRDARSADMEEAPAGSKTKRRRTVSPKKVK